MLRKILKNSHRGIGIAVFVYVLLHYDFHEIMRGVYQGEKTKIILALLMLVPFIVIKSERWRYLLAMQKITYSFSDALPAYSASMFWGLATPGRIGDFLKVIYLKKDCQVNISLGMSTVIIDRLLDLAVLVLTACLGAIFFMLPPLFKPFIVVAVIVYVLVVLFFLRGGNVKRDYNSIFHRFIPEKYFHAFIAGVDVFFQGMKYMKSSKMIIPLGMSVMAYSMLYLQCFLLSQAVGIPISFISISVFISFANIFALVPLTICGVGVRDVVLIGLFHNINLPGEMALSFSLLFLLISNVGTMAIGLIAWLKKPVSIEQL